MPSSRFYFYLALVLLGGCSANTSTDSMREYIEYPYDASNFSLSGGVDYNQYEPETINTVQVPETYHLGSYGSPVRAKDSDKNWVSSQNPQNYTIELAEDEKASYVAKKLQQVPKTNRMAEIKYEKNGKIYYKGLYGTYSNKQEAQKAFESLPAEIKKEAGIQQWTTVQTQE